MSTEHDPAGPAPDSSVPSYPPLPPVVRRTARRGRLAAIVGAGVLAIGVGGAAGFGLGHTTSPTTVGSAAPAATSAATSAAPGASGIGSDGTGSGTAGSGPVSQTLVQAEGTISSSSTFALQTAGGTTVTG